MKRFRLKLQVVSSALIVLITLAGALAADVPGVTHIPDVIYGRSYDTALTMHIYQPTQNANHIGVIVVVSGGWISAASPDAKQIVNTFIAPFAAQGYTVFAVSHGSQPKYTIPEILPQISRAVRFIRVHAKEYQVDPERLCITGGSAGGHLSLMQAYHPVPPDMKSGDPVDHEKADVFAVAVFFPPTDFLNYGKPGQIAWKTTLSWLLPPFDFQSVDPKTKQFVLITDEARREEIGKEISPITYVRAGVPATMLIHGDADSIVPYQQAEILVAKLKEANVPVKLITKPGKNHGWPNIGEDVSDMADFFAAQTGASSTKPSANASQP